MSSLTQDKGIKKQTPLIKEYRTGSVSVQIRIPAEDYAIIAPAAESEALPLASFLRRHALLAARDIVAGHSAANPAA